MKYFFDTEFLEGQQKKLFGKTKPTIDLISIGIVSEDGRSYYAIHKDFNLKEAWNRWQPRTGQGDRNRLQPREYWLRENVLRKIYEQLFKMYAEQVEEYERHRVVYAVKGVTEFNYKNMKWLLKRFGRDSRFIANDICGFIYGDDCSGSGMMSAFEMAIKYEISDKTKEPEFYAYYADYDWVVFCWLFGNMMSLPKGFPMYCRDLKQMLDEKTEAMSHQDFEELYKGLAINIPSEDKLTLNEKVKLIKSLPHYPKNNGEHDALEDAKWNRELFHFIKDTRYELIAKP